MTKGCYNVFTVPIDSRLGTKFEHDMTNEVLDQRKPAHLSFIPPVTRLFRGHLLRARERHRFPASSIRFEETATYNLPSKHDLDQE